MADGIYVSMCGAAARTQALDAIADNLANSQTPGFKASRPAFQAFLAASGAADKTYPAAVGTPIDARPGPSIRSGEPLDVLPEDGAFLAVKTPAGVAYTRDGRLSVDGAGLLVQAGRPVLDRAGQPLRVPPGSTPTVDTRGTVTAGDVTVGELGLHHLEGTLDRVGPTLYAPGPGGRATPVTGGSVRVGEVELGNSTALDGMVQLISAQRHFEASMQALQTYRSMDQRSNEMGRVR